jgi:hypothetical protein
MDVSCSECGSEATETVRIEFDDRAFELALCAFHVAILIEDARPMYPSRPRPA